MGVFTVKPDSASIVSGFFPNNTSLGVLGAFDLSVLLSTDTGLPPPFPRILQGISGSSVITVDNLLRLGFSLLGNIITVDGGPLINFAGLPAGFVITSATIHIYSFNDASDGTNHFRLQFDPTVESGDLGFGDQTFAYPTLSIPSTLLFFTEGCGIHVNNLTVGQRTARWISKFAVTGTYTIIPVSYQISLATPTSPIQTGDLITIINTSPLDLLHASSIAIDPSITIATSSFTVWTSNQITFPMPDITGSQPQVITVRYVDDGTQFTGSITAGKLITIYYLDGSGIYSLSVGKTSDTLYIHGTTPPQTVDVKKPDPFIKTGFLP